MYNVTNEQIFLQPVIPKRLRMMDDVKEVEDDDESKSKSNDADLHQHVSEDVKG